MEKNETLNRILSVPIKAITTPSSGPSPGGDSANPDSGHKPNIGAIAGGIAGGLAGLAVVLCLGVLFYTRSKRLARGYRNRENHVIPGIHSDVKIEPYEDTARLAQGATILTLRREKELDDRRMTVGGIAGSDAQSYTYPSEPSTTPSSTYFVPETTPCAENEMPFPQGHEQSNGASSKRDFKSEKGRRTPFQVPASKIRELRARPLETTQTQPLAHEVAELRRQIEQMRIERQGQSIDFGVSQPASALFPPPSYDGARAL